MNRSQGTIPKKQSKQQQNQKTNQNNKTKRTDTQTTIAEQKRVSWTGQDLGLEIAGGWDQELLCFNTFKWFISRVTIGQFSAEAGGINVERNKNLTERLSFPIRQAVGKIWGKRGPGRDVTLFLKGAFTSEHVSSALLIYRGFRDPSCRQRLPKEIKRFWKWFLTQEHWVSNVRDRSRTRKERYCFFTFPHL